MILAEEIAAVLRAAANGQISITIDDIRPWKEIYCGNVGMMLGAWYVVMFNDCDAFDYVDEVQAPDGRTGSYDDWATATDPLDLLTVHEADMLWAAVRAAPLDTG